MKKVLVGIAMIVALGVVIDAPTVEAADATLSWTANTEIDLSGYKIYFAPQSCSAQGPLAPLTINGSAVQVGKVSLYKHIGIPAIDGTLCWEITAFDTAGNESTRSNRVSVIVNTIPPVPPTGLSVAIQ